MTEPPVDARVDHPFQLTLAHRRLEAGEMIQVARFFDFRAVGGGRLVVDVDEVQAERTLLRITPNRPMTYDEIEQEADAIIDDLGPGAFGEVPLLERVDWLVPHPASGAVRPAPAR